MKNYKIKKLDKMKAKEIEKNSKILKNLDKEGSKNIIKLKNPDKSKHSKKKLSPHYHESHHSKKAVRIVEEKKFSYEELKIPAPEEFDYANFVKDWCRYCGSRFSSNFTKGPW